MIPYSIEANKYRKLIETFLKNFISVFCLAHIAACLWIRNYGQLTKSPIDDYNSAIYFLITTAATVGYGDITVDHKRDNNVAGRYIFASSLMIFALIFFAYVQSLITSLLLNFQAVDLKVKAKVEEFEDWLAVRNMTAGVVIEYRYEKNIKEFFDYINKYDIFSAISSDGYIDLMQFAQKEKIHESATEYVASRFSFFEELSASQRQKIILSLVPVSYSHIISGSKRVINLLLEKNLAQAFTLSSEGRSRPGTKPRTA